MMRAALFLVLLLGCAPERDYTLTACPSPAELASVEGAGVCDRGVGYAPRFVSWSRCEQEAGIAVGSTQRCNHPNRTPCPANSPPLLFCTFDSIAAALR